MESYKNIYYPKENNSAVVKALLSNRIWEKKIDKIMRDNIKPEWICIDAGAYIGSHALTMSKLCKEVHLFEPQPLIYNCLLKTKEALGIKNWYINNYALMNYDNGLIEFCSNNDGDARVMRSTFRRNWKYHLKVKTMKLDAHFAEIKKVNFIKIDVEGSEFELLNGAKGIITRDRPLIILETFVSKKNEFLLNEFLSNYNYSAEKINSENWFLTPVV